MTQYDQETFFGFNYGKLLEYTPGGKFLLYGRTDGSVCCALNPYRNAIFPSKGGNTGNVTVKIVTPDTFPLQEGAVVALSDGQAVIAPTVTSVLNSHVLTATFDLNGAPLGPRDVIINSPGSGMRTYPQGFTIEQGIAPQFSLDILGWSVIRQGVPSKNKIVYSNLSNVDIHDLLFSVTIPNELC